MNRRIETKYIILIREWTNYNNKPIENKNSDNNLAKRQEKENNERRSDK